MRAVELQCSRASYQAFQNRKEVGADICITNIVQALLNRGVPVILEHTMRRSEEVHTPQGQHRQRLYVLLDLELGYPDVVGILCDHVPSHGGQSVHKISPAS